MDKPIIRLKVDWSETHPSKSPDFALRKAIGQEYPWLSVLSDWRRNRPETLAVMLTASPNPPESVREALADAVRRKLASVEPIALREATEAATLAALLPPGPIPEPARLALVAVVRATGFKSRPAALTHAETVRVKKIAELLRQAQSVGDLANAERWRRALAETEAKPETVRHHRKRRPPKP